MPTAFLPQDICFFEIASSLCILSLYSMPVKHQTPLKPQTALLGRSQEARVVGREKRHIGGRVGLQIPQTQLLDSSLVRYSSGRLRDRTGDGQTSRAASQKLPETVTAGGNAEEPARMQSAHSSALPNPLSSRSMVSQEGAEDAPSRKRDEPAGGSSPVRSGAEKR